MQGATHFANMDVNGMMNYLKSFSAYEAAASDAAPHIPLPPLTPNKPKSGPASGRPTPDANGKLADTVGSMLTATQMERVRLEADLQHRQKELQNEITQQNANLLLTVEDMHAQKKRAEQENLRLQHEVQVIKGSTTAALDAAHSKMQAELMDIKTSTASALQAAHQEVHRATESERQKSAKLEKSLARQKDLEADLERVQRRLLDVEATSHETLLHEKKMREQETTHLKTLLVNAEVLQHEAEEKLLITEDKLRKLDERLWKEEDWRKEEEEHAWASNKRAIATEEKLSVLKRKLANVMKELKEAVRREDEALGETERMMELIKAKTDALKEAGFKHGALEEELERVKKVHEEDRREDAYRAVQKEKEVELASMKLQKDIDHFNAAKADYETKILEERDYHNLQIKNYEQKLQDEREFFDMQRKKDEDYWASERRKHEEEINQRHHSYLTISNELATCNEKLEATQESLITSDVRALKAENALKSALSEVETLNAMVQNADTLDKWNSIIAMKDEQMKVMTNTVKSMEETLTSRDETIASLRVQVDEALVAATHAQAKAKAMSEVPRTPSPCKPKGSPNQTQPVKAVTFHQSNAEPRPDSNESDVSSVMVEATFQKDPAWWSQQYRSLESLLVKIMGQFEWPQGWKRLKAGMESLFDCEYDKELLLEWVNTLVRKHEYPQILDNFVCGANCLDAYLCLLNVIAPQHLSTEECTKALAYPIRQKAELVLSTVSPLMGRPHISVDELISDEDELLHVLFVAGLFEIFCDPFIAADLSDEAVASPPPESEEVMYTPVQWQKKWKQIQSVRKEWRLLGWKTKWSADQLLVQKMSMLTGSSVPVLMELAGSHSRQGMYNSAIEMFTLVIQADPDMLEAYLCRAGLWQYVLKINFDLARDDIEKALLLDPENAWGYRQRADVEQYHSEDPDYSHALEDYNKAVSFGRNDAETWNNLGECLVQLDRLEDALQSFSYASALDPEYLDAGTNVVATVEKVKVLHAKRATEEVYQMVRSHAPPQFELESAVLKDSAAETLKVLADIIRRHAYTGIVVDVEAPGQEWKVLGEERAQAIIDFLAKESIATFRISANSKVGVGWSTRFEIIPVDPNGPMPSNPQEDEDAKVEKEKSP